MKWVVGGVVVVFMILVLVWVINTSSSDTKYPKEIMESTQFENATTEEMIVDAVQKSNAVLHKSSKKVDDVSNGSGVSYNQTTAVPNEPVTPHSIESALNSMRDGLADGDSRTPVLSEPVEYEQPTLDELNDPVLYQQYEKRQSLNQASAYFSAAVKELPVLRAKIAQARQGGSQTEEEIQEAEEALQKLELMQLEYQWQLPEASKVDISDE